MNRLPSVLMLGLLVLLACGETGPARREPPGDGLAPAFTPLIVDEADEIERPDGDRIGTCAAARARGWTTRR